MLVACDVEMLIYTVMFRFDIGAVAYFWVSVCICNLRKDGFNRG
jgi:hypothetical protein